MQMSKKMLIENEKKKKDDLWIEPTNYDIQCAYALMGIPPFKPSPANKKKGLIIRLSFFFYHQISRFFLLPFSNTFPPPLLLASLLD